MILIDFQFGLDLFISFNWIGFEHHYSPCSPFTPHTVNLLPFHRPVHVVNPVLSSTSNPHLRRWSPPLPATTCMYKKNKKSNKKDHNNTWVVSLPAKATKFATPPPLTIMPVKTLALSPLVSSASQYFSSHALIYEKMRTKLQ